MYISLKHSPYNSSYVYIHIVKPIKILQGYTYINMSVCAFVHPICFNSQL